MKEMNIPRIAVIGGGYWGRKVTREILNISRTIGAVQLHSIVDSSPHALSQCQAEFNSAAEYRSDYQDLLTDPSVTGVHICTPNATHFDVASRFLRQGKHVLVEKPLTLKTTDAFELVRLAKENGRVLCVGHIHRFNNGVRELRRIVAEGEIGEPYYVGMRWTGLMNPQFQREVITDLAPHPFDICNFLLEAWPDKVSCKGRGYRTKLSEEVAFITAEHKGGLMTHIEVSWLDRERRRGVTIIGEDGMAHLDCATQKVAIERENGKHDIPVTPSNTIAEEINHFADCIQKNQDSTPFSNHSDGILGARVVSLLEASRESMFQDRTIAVQLPMMPEIPVRQ